jgi:hypothetical protein
MADGRWQVLQGDLYMQINRSIVLEKYIGKSLRIQPGVLRAHRELLTIDVPNTILADARPVSIATLGQ